MHPGSSSDDDGVAAPSLWRDLTDGTAGWGIRIVLAIVSGVLLVGVGLVACYALAAVFPAFDRAKRYGWGSPRGVYPADELVAAVFVVAGAAWLVALVWLFARRASKRAFMVPSLVTVGLVAVTVALGIVMDSSLRGDSEMVIVGLSLISFAVIVFVWIQAFRAAARRRPMRNPLDRLADLRCPECGYRMVGLHESRCPECGKVYTLDELVLRQTFSPAGGATASPAPARSPVNT